MSDIPGLNSRISNKLEFLGLYGTQYSACRRHDIPAKQVSFSDTVGFLFVILNYQSNNFAEF